MPAYSFPVSKLSIEPLRGGFDNPPRSVSALRPRGVFAQYRYFTFVHVYNKDRLLFFDHSFLMSAQRGAFIFSSYSSFLLFFSLFEKCTTSVFCNLYL